MGNHGIRQSKRNDAAFPVRVKVAVPPFGLGKVLDAAQEWLNREIGPGHFACHSSPGIGCDTAAFYFRDVPAARRFFDAFPDLRLADGTLRRHLALQPKIVSDERFLWEIVWERQSSLKNNQRISTT